MGKLDLLERYEEFVVGFAPKYLSNPDVYAEKYAVCLT